MFKEEKEQILHIQARNVQGNIPYKALDNFIDAGGDIHLKNDEGKTPLQIACEHGNVMMVEYLIARGASVVEMLQATNQQMSKTIKALLYRKKIKKEINKEYFVGQNKIIQTLLSENEGDLGLFKKVLIAPSGHGKKHFLGLFKQIVSREILLIKVEEIIRAGDLAGTLSGIASPKIVVFEDAHLIEDEKVISTIRNAVEKNKIIIQIGNGSNIKTMVIDIVPNNYLFCFESKVLIPEWLSEIEIEQFYFEEYSEEEILTIITNEDVRRGYNSSPKELRGIVTESRGNPQLALGYLKGLKDKESILKNKIEKKNDEKTKAEEDRKKIKDMKDEIDKLKEEVSVLAQEIDLKEDECKKSNIEKKETLLSKISVKAKSDDENELDAIEIHEDKKTNKEKSKQREDLSCSPLTQARQQSKRTTIDVEKEQASKITKAKDELKEKEKKKKEEEEEKRRKSLVTADEVKRVMISSKTPIATICLKYSVAAVFINLLGRSYKEKKDYYEHLLYNFLKDEPACAMFMIAPLVDVINGKKAGIIDGLFAGIGLNEFNTYKIKLQKKDIIKYLKSYESRKQIRESDLERNSVWTSNSKVFYILSETQYKNGLKFKEFELPNSGTHIYLKTSKMNFKTIKEAIEHFSDKGIVCVTELMSPEFEF